MHSVYIHAAIFYSVISLASKADNIGKSFVSVVCNVQCGNAQGGCASLQDELFADRRALLAAAHRHLAQSAPAPSTAGPSPCSTRRCPNWASRCGSSTRRTRTTSSWPRTRGPAVRARHVPPWDVHSCSCGGGGAAFSHASSFLPLVETAFYCETVSNVSAFRYSHCRRVGMNACMRISRRFPFSRPKIALAGDLRPGGHFRPGPRPWSARHRGLDLLHAVSFRIMEVALI